jgi:hypothetical protein
MNPKNQRILEQRVKELIEFFEKHPNGSKTMGVLEYRNILNGLVLLIRKSSSNIDFTDHYNYFESGNTVSNNQLTSHIEAVILKCKTPIYIEYKGVLTILKMYEICLKKTNRIALTKEERVDLSTKIRVLELERLWINLGSK